jgi:hypothetical protein
MATQFIQTTSANTYNDDYSDSDNYYKVLFNNGRALQQRELNQMQTIIQNDQRINSDFIYQHGTAAIGGRTKVRNQSNFIKLNETVHSLPKDATLDPAAVTQASAETIEGLEFTQATTNSAPAIKFRVNKVVIKAGSDDAAVYVTYIDGADQDGTANEGIRITPGNTFSNAANSITLQSSTTDPAFGKGTIFEVNEGKFYLEGHFVHTAKQTLVVSKFTSTYSGTVGFKVTEDVVTTADDQDLFDNSGATLNLASPGADRYRISLELIDQANVEPGDYFFPIAEVARGSKFRDNAQSDPVEQMSLDSKLALRTSEESGSYLTGRMLVDFETNEADATKVDMIISPSTAYVQGNRYQFIKDIPITIDKPRTTANAENVATAISYGNYVLVTTMLGIMRVDQFSQVNLRDAITHGGNTIGTARVRAIEKDGTNFRIYLFEVIMANAKNFSQVKSLGTSTIIYGDIDRKNTGVDNGLGGSDVAILRDATNNNLLFDVSKDRPKSISDITLTKQYRVAGSTDGSGNVELTCSTLVGGGKIWDDGNSWIATADDDGTVDTDLAVTIASNGATAVCAGLDANQAHTFIVYAQNTGAQSATVKTKTLTTVGATAIGQTTIDGKAGSVALGFVDVFDMISIVNSAGADISDRYVFDNGQRDNFYDQGKLILKGGATAPSGNVTVSFRYFAHATTGDFFAANSYPGAYEDIPSHRTTSGETIQLRDVLDFRPDRATNGINFHTGTNAQILPLPRVNDLVNYDVSFYLGQKGIAYVHTSGKIGIELGEAEEFPKFPVLGQSYLKLARCHIFPYMLNDEDVYVSHIDNKRYTMRDIGNIEKRVDEIEELTALNMLELATQNLEVFDSAGNSRLKSGITADNFANHFQSDTTLSEYRASIDPARNELRPEFVARPIELVYDHAASTNAILKGDKVMLSYTETTYRTQASASRHAIVNPFGTERQTGTIVMSPASDNWSDTNTSVRITKGDTSFDVGAGKSFGDWDFNWSGVTDDQLDNFKTGDIVGSRVVHGGTYKRRVPTGMQQVGPGNDYIMGYETKEYNKRTYQNYNISGISTVRETIGTVVKSTTSITHMRSRFISFKATGLRPNTEYFGFFNGINISAFMNTSEGTGGFVRWAALARTSPYLEVDNIYGGISTYPSGLGSATAKMLTDANGAISGYFLLPNTTGVTKTSGGPLRFKAGRQIFTLLDISVFNITNASSIAEFIYESSGVIKEVEENIRESRVVQIGSASSSRDAEIVRPGQADSRGPSHDIDGNAWGGHGTPDMNS